MRILAVDDDPVSLDLLEALISKVGDHQLFVADSGATALSMIAESPIRHYECLMLDIQMPGINGIELCELIRSNAVYTDVPILMITSMSEKGFIDDAFKAGATDYLTKPFDISELRGRLNILSRIADTNRVHTEKIFSAAARRTKKKPRVFGLHSPVPVNDIEGAIDYCAMENYVSQLSRNALFGSSVFALKILGILEIFERISQFEFQGLMIDVAEAITLAMQDHQALTAYAGNGTFVCVVDEGWRPSLKRLVDDIQHYLAIVDPHLNGGTPINVYLCAGESIRLLSRGGDRSITALSEAQESVEKVCAQMERSPLGMCLAQHSA